ncbi:trypsin-like serine protease [Hyalangium versicolor]|uniref:trypsin-like serine protease n=1 Tax=Hyalangium versicolor TaxID=2861190 RepID=UPI001CCAD0DD|nr:trypsin-like serine protease [Hyalangium versicolor]
MNPEKEEQALRGTPKLDAQHVEGDVFRLAGTVDSTNRFQSTVVVVARLPAAPSKGLQCSGVLLDPRVVLTAGHCVCGKAVLSVPDGEERMNVDGSSCAAHATVETVVYDPPMPGEGMGAQRHEYRGRVIPHPKLRIHLNKEGSIVSSDGDLAVILLDSPVDRKIQSMQLAEADVVPHESIVLVGYGSDERLGGMGGERRFNETRVAANPWLAQGSVLFEQPGRDIYRGESGGPCLRESARGWVLVGVSGRGLGKEPIFIDTYPYRSWLLEQIHRAADVETDGGL